MTAVRATTAGFRGNGKNARTEAAIAEHVAERDLLGWDTTVDVVGPAGIERRWYSGGKLVQKHTIPPPGSIADPEATTTRKAHATPSHNVRPHRRR